MRRVFLREPVAFVRHCETAVRPDRHFDIVAVVYLVKIRQELLGRVVFGAARCRAMQLPEVFEPRRLVDDLPVLGRTTLSLTVVHHRDPCTNSVHQLRCP